MKELLDNIRVQFEKKLTDLYGSKTSVEVILMRYDEAVRDAIIDHIQQQIAENASKRTSE